MTQLAIRNTQLTYCKTRIFRVQKEKNHEIKYPQKFSLPIKRLVNTSRTPGKHQIKMQRNFNIPKSRNSDAAKI